MLRALLLLLALVAAVTAQEGARHVIFCRDDFLPAIQPLADWRHARGMKTMVVPLSQVGSDTASVRSYIVNAWNTWEIRPEFILLVAHPSYLRAKIHGSGPEMVYSDNYFGDVEGDYRGEIPVGRFPARSLAQCELMVEKTLAYERQPDVSDPDWMRRLTTVVREDYDWDDTIYWNNARFAAQLAASVGFVSCDSLSRSRGNTWYDIVRSVNNGTGLVLYRGSGTGNWRSPFDVNPAQAENGWRLPVIVSATCAMMALDPYDSMVGSAWVKTGTPGSLGGAVAFFGNTHSDVNVAPLRGAIARGFFANLFVEGDAELGRCALGARDRLFDEFGADLAKNDYRGFNLFGDPALRLWTGTPLDLSVTHASEIVPGHRSLEVTVSHDGSPVRYAEVCASMDSTVFACGTTSPDGRVLLDVSPRDTGQLRLVVTGTNLYPYDGVVHVVTEIAIEENPWLPAGEDPALSASPAVFMHSTILRLSGRVPDGWSLVIRSGDGRAVRRYRESGERAFRWDGRDGRALPAEAGVYFCQLVDNRDGVVARTRVTLLR